MLLPAGYEEMTDEEIIEALCTTGPMMSSEDATATVAMLRRGEVGEALD